MYDGQRQGFSFWCLFLVLTSVKSRLIYARTRHEEVTRTPKSDQGSVAGKVAEFYCRGYSPKKVPPLPSSPPDLNLHRPEPAPDTHPSRVASRGSPRPRPIFC